MAITAHIRTSFSHIGEIDPVFHPSELTLLLGIQATHVRYFVKSNAYNRIIYYGEYTLHHINNDTELAEAIAELMQKDEVLRLAFGKVYAGVTGDFTIVPSMFAGLAEEPGAYVNEIANNLDVSISFNIGEALSSALKQDARKPEVKHLHTSLLEQIPLTPDYNNKLFINVGNETFDLVKFENNSLKLLNTYSFKAPQDFIYFVLLCCEELKINREETDLVLMGEIDRKSELYDICYRYFRSVLFMDAPQGLSFSNAFETFPAHLYFNIYTLGK
jgi:hypothetical protein